jgi:hypothetical protein
MTFRVMHRLMSVRMMNYPVMMNRAMMRLRHRKACHPKKQGGCQ